MEKLLDDQELLAKKIKEAGQIADPKQREEELKKLDKVAYVRFASVYRHFRDINEFMSELNSLLNVKE